MDHDLVGSVIDGRFEILAPLGKGGMATVFRATQRSIGREVAIKVMDRQLSGDPVAVKRFLREAQLASQLAHPNVVSVIDFGQTAGGALYLAMELVRGRTLHDVFAREAPLPLARIQRIGAQLCDALEAAHALQIIHRDLKLENVMVLERDLIKVLDFGLARSLVDPAGRATATGTITGTPLYLAPEVAFEAAAPAPAQDVYALGVILAELATGRAPWNAATLDAVFVQKVERAPQLDGIDGPLRGLFDRMLAATPGARPSVAEVRRELAAIRELPFPPIALEPTREMPSAAFRAPAPAEPALELEHEWKREKAARLEIETVHDPAPARRKLRLAGVVAAVAIVGIVAAVVVAIARSPAAPQPPAPPRGPLDGVVISVRAVPAAKIAIDGHDAGRTPLSVHVPRGTQPVTIDATFRGRTLTKTVVPDHDQLVDFVP